MPELPEVENVRRTVAATAVGRLVISAVHVPNAGIPVLRGDAGVLNGGAVVDVRRHGKQLALIGETGAVAVHLGMTGRLLRLDADTPDPPHTHLSWLLDTGDRLAFSDPRRFGGVWSFDSDEALRCARWSRLGPDALRIGPAALHAGLSRTRRHLKCALLDQSVVAGLGNIYVDELLFNTGFAPERPADTLSRRDSERLVRAMRTLLRRAIDAGGSTLRDYVDAEGAAGGFQHRHRVYGRGGRPCRRCRRTLEKLLIAQRTTVWCPTCQR